MSLKVLVDRATDIPDNPTTLFVLLEFGKTKLATSHVIVRNPTSVRFNEEAEFGIKKSGNLRIQLCSATEKKKLLSTKVNTGTLDRADSNRIGYFLGQDDCNLEC